MSMTSTEMEALVSIQEIISTTIQGDIKGVADEEWKKTYIKPKANDEVSWTRLR